MAEAVAEKTPSHVVLFNTPEESNAGYHQPVVVELGDDLVSEAGAMQAINNIVQQIKSVTPADTVTRVTIGGTANVSGDAKPGAKRVASVHDTKDVPCHPLVRAFLQGVFRNTKAIATGVWQSAPGVAQTGVWAGNTALNQYRANVKTLGDFVKQAIGDLEKGTPEYNERLTAVQAQVAPIIEFAKQSIPAIIEGAKKWKAGHPDGELPPDVLDLMD